MFTFYKTCCCFFYKTVCLILNFVKRLPTNRKIGERMADFMKNTAGFTKQHYIKMVDDCFTILVTYRKFYQSGCLVLHIRGNDFTMHVECFYEIRQNAHFFIKDNNMFYKTWTFYKLNFFYETICNRLKEKKFIHVNIWLYAWKQ